MSHDAGEEKKIIIDEGWKERVQAEKEAAEQAVHLRSYYRLACGRRGVRVQTVRLKSVTLVWAINDATEMNRMEMEEACRNLRDGEPPNLDYLP